MELSDIKKLLIGKWKVDKITQYISGLENEKCPLSNDEEGTIITFEEKVIYDSAKKVIVKDYELLKNVLYVKEHNKFGYIRFFDPFHCRYKIVNLNKENVELSLYKWGTVDQFVLTMILERMA